MSTTTPQTESPALREIREALTIRTHHLGRFDCDAASKLANAFWERLACECWGHKMGWTIPPFGTLEWDEMREAWLASVEDEA